MEVQASDSSLLVESEVFVNLSLHLDDVEFLQNAFIVQAAVGPLVRFSNRGRYEPYVAKSWSQDGDSWSFELNESLTCEDGQKITAESFKNNLEQSLKRFSPEEIAQTPFSQLDRITASGNVLKLSFKQSVGKALLEYLAMTPFSFLCDANFSGKEWKSNEKFISSGPYKVVEFDASKNTVTLKLRTDWPLSPPNAFKQIYLTEKGMAGVQPTAKLEMTYGKSKSAGSKDSLVLEVPRALLSVRLGIEDQQFFSARQNRQVLQSSVDEILKQSEIPFENYHRAETFFFGQASGHETARSKPVSVAPPKHTLKVRGLPKGVRPEADFYQGILFEALDKLGWRYEIIAKPVGTVKEFFNQDYDIAFDRSHVDATLDPDFVRLLFKSKLGPRYQDPGNRISNLVDQFDKGFIAYRDFLVGFNSAISEEAAILPLYHRGFAWQFSSNVDTSGISPLMSILRYEELTLKPNGSN